MYSSKCINSKKRLKMRLYKLLFCLIVFALANNILSAQTISIIRCDVDSSRANFITAGYLFSMDIAISEMDSVSSASFDLSYTQSDYIRFSDAVHTKFGAGGRKPVVIHRIDSATKTGYVYVGVISADSLGGRGIDNPLIIHLEFAVSPNAPNGLVTTFAFNRPQAVITKGVIGDLVKNLKSKPTEFVIHGFIEVWPGDADNDGEVTSMDVTQIGRYIAYGSTKNFQMRSFKRRNASTIWQKQYSMAWDSVLVTFADCDGNGDVTVTDQLIVALNFYKKHNANINTTPIVPAPISNAEAQEKRYTLSATDKYKDIYVSSDIPFSSLAGTIKWTATDRKSKVIGIEKANLFANSHFFEKIDTENNIIHLSDLQLGNIKDNVRNGKLCRLIIDGEPENIILSRDFSGISDKDYIFKINSKSNVETEDINNNTHTVRYSENVLSIISSREAEEVAFIYNERAELFATQGFSKSLQMYLPLPAGVYFVKIGKKEIQKIIV